MFLTSTAFLSCPCLQEAQNGAYWLAKRRMGAHEASHVNSKGNANLLFIVLVYMYIYAVVYMLPK